MPSVVVGPLLVVAAYVAGAMPWGFLLGCWFGDVDLRTRGSGGTGATNAMRVLGWRVSLAVLALDAGKGFVPVAVARLAGLDGWWVAGVGVAAVAGHCWSPMIGFRGGKGMATGAGAAAGMLPWVLLVLPLMVVIVALTRYVSLASLSGSLVVSLVLVALSMAEEVPWSVTVAILGITAIIVVQHKDNIRRLLAGTERRLGEPARS